MSHYPGFIMPADESRLPSFRYFPDPVDNGVIEKKQAVCPCCETRRAHMYTGPIYAVEPVDEVCPWCIADGSAADRWSASFNDVGTGSASVPREILREVLQRTPGYRTWQTNVWMYAGDDAMVFIGEISGMEVADDGDTGRIEACLAALAAWYSDEDLTVENLRTVEIGGDPAIYLFQDRNTGAYAAYADMS